MSFFWGTNWKFRIQGRAEWWRPWENVEMRLLLRSKVVNFKFSYLIQDDITPGESNAQAVITGPTMAPINFWDIRDWAITQMGTPYWTFPNPPNPSKAPYKVIDCSGLVISARIQDIGVENNIHYRLNHIGVFHMNQGYYEYPGPPENPNMTIPLELTEIQEAEAGPNDIVLIARRGHSYSHVAIINDARQGENGEILLAHIIHAKGDTRKHLRQVRFDNFLGTYSRGTYLYKFMRFE